MSPARALLAAVLAAACSNVPEVAGDAATDGSSLVPRPDAATYFSQDPRHVRLSWTDDPARTITAMWSTAFDAPVGEIALGTAPDALTTTAFATARTIGTALTGRVTVHRAFVAELYPDTTYHYRVGAEGHWSALYRFKTAPAAMRGGDVNFIVCGDSGDDMTVWRALSARALASIPTGAPDFAIFTGDAVADPTLQSAWNAWFDAAGLSLASMPWVMVHGHREALATPFLQQFAQPPTPGDGLYFSFEYGPMHVTVLNDTVAAGLIGLRTGPELAFLASDLASVDRARTPWLIVAHHRPPYASGRRAQEPEAEVIRTLWTPLFDRYDVDLVFNGHAHDFEVTRPLHDQRVVAEGRGAVYFTSGGAGARLDNVSPSQLTRHVERTQSFLAVHATRTALEVIPHRLDGTIISAGQVRLVRP